MNQKRTPKQQIAIRSFSYGIMTIVVLLGVALCLAWAMGFRFDFGSGQISRIALLQFNSFPTAATVDVGGKQLSSKTPTRLNIETGQTTVTMTKSGYRSWSKTVNAAPSSVRWLNYVRFVPQNVTTDSVKSFAKVEQMIASPDKRWIILRTDATSREVILADVANPAKPKFSTLAVDPSLLDGATDENPGTLELVEWDQGSRYILLKFSLGDKTDYLELDRQNPGFARNLSRDFNLTLSDPHFSGTGGNVFFALTGSDLRKFDYGSKSVSAPLASGVQNYRPYGGSRLAYVATADQNGKTVQTVGVYDDGQAQTIKTYDEVIPTFAEFAEFNGEQYLAIARAATLAIYSDPLDNGVIKQLREIESPGEIEQFGFSPSGRFVVATHEKKAISYDLETSENYLFELDKKPGGLVWIDDYHLLDSGQNSVAFIEFDGANREKIVSGRGQAALSADGKYLFSLSDTAGGTVLQRSRMVID